MALVDQLALDRVEMMLGAPREDLLDFLAADYMRRDVSLPSRLDLSSAEALEVLRATAAAANARRRELRDLDRARFGLA